jgi:hypothetical protein
VQTSLGRTKVEGGLTYTYAADWTDELVSVIRTGGSTQNFTFTSTPSVGSGPGP